MPLLNPQARSLRGGRLVYTVISQQADPVWKIRTYRRWVEVVADLPASSTPEPGKRSKITELSHESRQRMAFVACNSPCDWLGLLTLTYQADIRPQEGRGSKGHLNAYLVGLRRRYPGIKILWFMEFTRAGSVHYHLLTTRVPPDRARAARGGLWCPESSRLESAHWSKLWRSRAPDFNGWTTHMSGQLVGRMERASVRWEPVRSADGGARYAAKYAAKCEQKTVPSNYRNCGRFWGASRGVRPEEPESITISESEWQNLTGEPMRRTPYNVPYHFQMGLADKLRSAKSSRQPSDGQKLKNYLEAVAGWEGFSRSYSVAMAHRAAAMAEWIYN